MASVASQPELSFGWQKWVWSSRGSFPLHEFEALLFSSPNEIASTMTSPKIAATLQAIRAQFPTPEDINENPPNVPLGTDTDSLPSNQKPLHGSLASQRKGLDRIRI